MSKKFIDEKQLSIPEVKEIMEKFKKKVISEGLTEDISHFQQITLDYVSKFSQMSEKQAKAIIKMLQKDYEIEEIFAVNVVNIAPTTIPELRVIFEKSVGKELDDDKLQEILYKIEEIRSK